jgi:hypothetical protein
MAGRAPERSQTMPYLAHLSIRISRKFQIERDDWLGVDALATIAVEEA